MDIEAKVDAMQRVTDVSEEDDPELQAFADEKNVTLLAFVGSYVPRRYGPTQFGRSTMSMADEFSIEGALTNITSRYETEKHNLYLLVNTPGGLVASSFKIAMAIRRCFNDITVFVPHIAASGGTMLALTGNRIRMGMMSQLSPVYVQVPYKDAYVSANSLLVAEMDLADRVSKKRPDELSYMETHLIDSIDPAILVEMKNVVNMGERYLKQVLKEARYSEDDQEKITANLIFELPTHEFVIQRDLAREIGIVVENGESNPEEWEMMRKWFWRYITKAADKHFVRYVMPKKG